MSVIKNIVTSDIFVLGVIPLVIVVGVLYLCKIYKFSLIPKSLKPKKKGKFRMPKLNRKELDRSLGKAGKYEWTLEEEERPTPAKPPVHISEARVNFSSKNMYN